MWALHLNRCLVKSTRSSLASGTQCTLFKDLCRRPFSTGREAQYSFLRNQSLIPKNGVFRRLAASTSGSKPPTQDKIETGDATADKLPDISAPENAETVVKGKSAKKSSRSVLATGKSKSARKKTDFSKEYQDNIYVEYDRAKYEYILSDDQLKDLQVYKRRSPYPESDNIRVYRRDNLVSKAADIWGNLDNLQKERKRRELRDIAESYRYSGLSANKKFLLNHEFTSTEKPFIHKAFPNDKPSTEPQVSIFKTGPGKVVLWAISINAANMVIKFIAWLSTGSHSMFSEFIHSCADTVNQIILAIGLHQSLKKADQEHPYGWSNFRNVASLISGVGIFCLGAGASFYHGFLGIAHPETMDSIYWGIATLFGSFISEGVTLIIAFSEIQKAAKREGVSFMNYVWTGRDPSTNVVLLEDAAAVSGVTIAAACMTITHLTANPLADAVGSILIGGLLGGVASVIIYTNTIALVGRSISAQRKAELMQELENDRMIRALHDVKATSMGGHHVRFKAEVDFDGREITRLYLENSDIETILTEVQSLNTAEELETFMLKHGENIVDTLGSEVDRIEKKLKSRHPEVRHVDLEQL